MESVLKLTRALFQYQKLIKSKNVVVIDDSIVRGTSSQSIIKILRSSGASKITLIVTFPPIKYPCYAGIDFPSQDELLAFQNQQRGDLHLESEIAKSIGADKVIYNDTVTLAEAIGINEKELCFSCSTGNYKPLGIKPVFKTRAEVKGEV
jgi:Glutamine phosphoribosylpyrophosphate amidotransferase